MMNNKEGVGRISFRQNTSDHLIFEHVYIENEYGIPELNADDVIIDVGAHCGYFAKLCLDKGSKNVVCFEAEKENYQYLLHHLSEYDGWKAYNCAIWKDGADEITLHTFPKQFNSGMNSVYKWEGKYLESEVQTCKAIPLDAVLENFNKIKILKLDVEGSEYEIILNSKLIDKVEIIVAEYHIPDDNFKYQIKDIEQYLTSKNFEVRVTQSKFLALNKNTFGKKRKVIDSFMFLNEFDILKLRLNYLNDVVDHFIISESKYTHSGKLKPYYLDEIIHEIPEEIRKKIIRIKYEPDISQYQFPSKESDYHYENANWKLERQQRDLISKHLSEFSSDDLFMISDVDEIPRKEVIRDIVNNNSENNFCYVAACELFFYNFTTFYFDNWGGTVFSTVQNAVEKGCDYFRTNRNTLFSPIKNGGWHFSYFGGINQIKYKLDSYAHQENNKEQFKNDQNLIDAIENKKDLFRRGEVPEDKFSKYNYNNFPEDLRNIIEKVYPKEYYTSKNTINVCFSTIPPRFKVLDQIIESYYQQTVRPNKIIITISKNYYRFSYEDFDFENLYKKYSDFVHLIFVEDDYGPATKIYGALKSLEMYPDSYVMVCDDDMTYDPRLIECYLKCIEVSNESVWTPIDYNNVLNLSHKIIWNLQGCATYLFYPKLLEKFNAQNFEQLYFEFVHKNANPQEVFLHDDYFISCILYDLQVPIRSFNLSEKVYKELPIPTQIHHLYKCHSDEIKLIQNIRKSYGELNTFIHCDYLDVDSQKVDECDIQGELDVDKYHQFIGGILEKYKVFRVRILAKTYESTIR